MKILNELFDNSCRPGYKSYKKVTDRIILIDNFFEDFDSARNFFINRDKWKCNPYQGYSKPGSESIFPEWVGKSLMEKYVLENKINDDQNSYKIKCNFFYNENNCVWSLPNSTYFPHIDNIENNNIVENICLINLNLIPVSTKFYTFKNNECCNIKLQDELENYTKKISEELIKFYDKETMITSDEVKLFLESKKELDVKLIKTVQYNPNQAIIYPANLFHSPNVTEEFTEENPRSLLRITFDYLMNKNKTIVYN